MRGRVTMRWPWTVAAAVTRGLDENGAHTEAVWLLGTVLQLITLAGDYVADDIWHRVVQIVTNHEDLQMQVIL